MPLNFDTAVIGGGSFGTAVAEALGRNGKRTAFWMRNEEAVQHIKDNHENPKYFPGVTLSDNIYPTSSLEEAVRDTPVIFVSVPSSSFRDVAFRIGEYIDGSQVLVSTTKGIEPKTFLTMSEILKEETCCIKVGALSGPNLAGELMDKMPSGTVIASPFEEVILKVQNLMASPYVRVYSNSDLQGVELGGALKNIYAVCSGIISALGFGENTRSLMMARGLTEMSRFACKMGASPLTFIGLAGVGDMIATCSSNKSRNFQVGYFLGQGKSLEESVKELGQTAEGVNTIKQVKEKAEEEGIYMPILFGMFSILYEGKSVDEELQKLMQLHQQSDIEFQLK